MVMHTQQNLGSTHFGAAYPCIQWPRGYSRILFEYPLDPEFEGAVGGAHDQDRGGKEKVDEWFNKSQMPR